MQVLTSGISAEYGRFSGGVINTITKSGSNTFSGSFRTNLYKPDWTGETPFETANGQDRTGSLANNTSYETTVGGPIVQDRLWFFYANRVQRESQSETFAETGIGYDRELRNDRNLRRWCMVAPSCPPRAADPPAACTAGGTQSRYEVTGPSKVQDQVSRP